MKREILIFVIIMAGVAVLPTAALGQQTPKTLLHCPNNIINSYRIERSAHSPTDDMRKSYLGKTSSLDLYEITDSIILDPNTMYYVPDPPLLIHGVGGQEIDVVIPSDTSIVLAEDWDYGIVVYDGANVHFGEPAPEFNEPNIARESADANNPVLPVWVIGESGYPFFNNFCGIFIDRTAGTRCKLDNIYLSGFYYGTLIDQQLDSPISNVHTFGCYNGILSLGPNRILNSSVSYYGIWSPEWQYYGQAYCFLPESWDGNTIFEGADFGVYNSLADDGDDGFTCYGLYEPCEPPNFYSMDCVATNCYSAFNGWDGYVGFDIICPGLYNNYQNKNFSEMPFTAPVYEVNDPLVIDPNDYRTFLNPDSNFVDHGSGLSPYPGWTTSIDGTPDKGIGDIWPHYQTKRFDKSADLNSDYVVDINDLAEFVEQWLIPNPNSADLNNDCKVDFLDYSVFANKWQQPEMYVEPVDVETSDSIDPNNISGYVGIRFKNIPVDAGMVYVYVDNSQIGVWGGGEFIGFESHMFSNGWHIIRFVSTDIYGGVINHKPINVCFNNLLYKVSASGHFHPDEDYKFSGFYDGNNTLEATVTNMYDQVIWSNTYSGPHINIVISGTIFGSEQFCELSITEGETILKAVGESVAVVDSRSSTSTSIDLTKKFKQTDYPAGAKMVIVLPNKDVFKARKPAILECAEACEKRGVSWVYLYGDNVTWGNLTYLYTNPNVKYIYWCGHSSSHVDPRYTIVRLIEKWTVGLIGAMIKRYPCTQFSDYRDGRCLLVPQGVPRTHTGLILSYTRQTHPGADLLGHNLDQRGFDLYSLGMSSSGNKKIVFIDGCWSAFNCWGDYPCGYNDMAEAYGIYSNPGVGDQIYIGWRVSYQLYGKTTEGIRMFWEAMGNGDDVYDALHYTYQAGGEPTQKALWGTNGTFDLGDFYEDNDDNIYIYGGAISINNTLDP